MTESYEVEDNLEGQSQVRKEHSAWRETVNGGNEYSGKGRTRKRKTESSGSNEVQVKKTKKERNTQCNTASRMTTRNQRRHRSNNIDKEKGTAGRVTTRNQRRHRSNDTDKVDGVNMAKKRRFQNVDLFSELRERVPSKMTQESDVESSEGMDKYSAGRQIVKKKMSGTQEKTSSNSDSLVSTYKVFELPMSMGISNTGAYIRKRQRKPSFVLAKGIIPDREQEATKRFICVECGKGFDRKVNLEHHEKRHGKRAHKCKECGKRFAVVGDLRRHKRTHSEDKPHKCDISGKCYKTRGSLYTHTKIHTGEKPFMCMICSRYFRQKHHLEKHLLTHVDTNRLHCLKCGRAFQNKTSLTFHLKNYNHQHQCSLCSITFNEQQDLKSHLLLSHPNEEAHKCEHCSESYWKKGDLMPVE